MVSCRDLACRSSIKSRSVYLDWLGGTIRSNQFQPAFSAGHWFTLAENRKYRNNIHYLKRLSKHSVNGRRLCQVTRYNIGILNQDSISTMDESQLRAFALSLLNQASDNKNKISQLSSVIAQRDIELAQRNAEISRRDAALQRKDEIIRWKEERIAQLTHEMAVLKRWKFGRSREGLTDAQLSLLDETIDADLAGIEMELDELREGIGEAKPRLPSKPRRAPLPPELPPRVRHIFR
jgi:hypothetical protein